MNSTIPPGVGNLTMLNQLDLSDNNMRGNLPKELYSLKSLYYLRLQSIFRHTFTVYLQPHTTRNYPVIRKSIFGCLAFVIIHYESSL